MGGAEAVPEYELTHSAGVHACYTPPMNLVPVHCRAADMA
jgi:hypothetical protein